MKQTTLCYCVTKDQVLLGFKKIRFGAGKWNGYGGKLEEGEAARVAALRELQEESGIVGEDRDLEQMALARFFFEEQPIFECSIFIIRKWKGEPIETDEMKPQWYPIDALPFDAMWDADRVWLPMILRGEKFEADIIFNSDGSKLKEFRPVPRTF